MINADVAGGPEPGDCPGRNRGNNVKRREQHKNSGNQVETMSPLCKCGNSRLFSPIIPVTSSVMYLTIRNI